MTYSPQLFARPGPYAPDGRSYIIFRRINGYWDHALKGEWKGARSSSLNEQWRVIYVVKGSLVRIMVLKVTPHDYRRK